MSKTIFPFISGYLSSHSFIYAPIHLSAHVFICIYLSIHPSPLFILFSPGPQSFWCHEEGAVTKAVRAVETRGDPNKGKSLPYFCLPLSCLPHSTALLRMPLCQSPHSHNFHDKTFYFSYYLKRGWEIWDLFKATHSFPFKNLYIKKNVLGTMEKKKIYQI